MHIPSTKERPSSRGEGGPPQPTAQLWEERTWSCEGGREHLSSQKPDHPHIQKYSGFKLATKL